MCFTASETITSPQSLWKAGIGDVNIAWTIFSRFMRGSLIASQDDDDDGDDSVANAITGVDGTLLTWKNTFSPSCLRFVSRYVRDNRNLSAVARHSARRVHRFYVHLTLTLTYLEKRGSRFAPATCTFHLNEIVAEILFNAA